MTERSPEEQRIREDIRATEAELARVDETHDNLANCALHIKYWRLRESLAAMAVSNLDGDAKSRKDNYLLLRQASDQCRDWQQRYDAAKKDGDLAKLAKLEQLVKDRLANASSLEALASRIGPRKRGRPKKHKD